MRATLTSHILVKAEELYPGVVWQGFWVWVCHARVTGAGKHMTPVVPQCIDTSVADLQQQPFLDAVEDAVGEINLLYEKIRMCGLKTIGLLVS